VNEREHEEGEEEEPRRFAVPGPESHESPETLGPDERDDLDEDAPLPGPAEPRQPSPKR
jgi:hypothetical protein